MESNELEGLIDLATLFFKQLFSLSEYRHNTVQGKNWIFEIIHCIKASNIKIHIPLSMYVYSSPYIIITIPVQKAQKDGRIPNAPGYAGLLGQISSFRSSLTSVAAYGHIPVPLVYTQVVTLAVYVYFIVALIGEQWIIWRSDIKVFYFIYNFTLMFGEHG